MLSGIRARLLVTFLLASVLPLSLGGLVFYGLVNQTITSETFQKVGFARDAKSSEISQYLTHARKQAEDLAQSSNVRYSVGEFYGFSYAIGQLAPTRAEAGALLRDILGSTGPDPQALGVGAGDRLLREALEYANVHRRFHGGFLSFLNDSPFDNLYLIDRNAQVVYAARPDAYLGRHLDGSGAGLDQALSALQQRARATPQVQTPLVQDFARDAVTGEFVAYLAVPVVLHTRTSGALVLRMPVTGVQALLAGGETPMSVLSSTGALIARSDPEQSSAAIGQHPALPAEMTQPAAVAILDAGLTGVPALTAWGRLDPPHPPWLVVAEAPSDQAFFNSRRLGIALLIIGAGTVAVLAVLVFLFSKSLTRPVQRLAEAASAVAEGSLNETLPEYDQPVEYARLSRAVGSMRRSLRDHLDLIRDKNEALQQNLRQIEEKNQKLEEADRMKDRFLANTSHELRTPLNGIIGILETLESGAMGEMRPTQTGQLRLITASARRLSRLVDDLLDIYRIREGRMRLDLQPVNVGHALRNVTQLVTPLLPVGQDGVKPRFHLDLQQDLPAVEADPVRFEQILFNLMSNAAKYGGGRDVAIRAAAEGDQLVVRVTDQGPGMAPESLERIFHPLEQLTPSSHGQQQGTGLGLTIARNLAVLMGGRIEVESALGQGTSFALTLPLSDAPAPAAPEDFTQPALPPLLDLPAPVEDPAPGEDAPVVLCVDDEPINLQVLHNVLTPQGYRVIRCASGSEALRSVATARPDLILLDVMMPGMNGLDVARTLRRRYGLHELPIILLTARSRSSDMLAGFDAGANDYVVKPFVKDELLSRIRTLLQASRAQRSSAENLDLRAEIERRVQIEDALRLSQRRMTQLLNTLEDGLLCVNARDVITYANEAAVQVLGRPVQLNQTLLADLLPRPLHERIAAVEAGDDPDQLSLTLQDQAYSASIFAMMPEAGGGKAILLSTTERGQGAAFVQSLRDVVDTSLPSLIAPEGPGAQGKPPRDPYRDTIVDLMTEALDLWSDLTGKGKIEFAEASGIWRVNLDKTSLQTRTLDKYLLADTLPANPRWRDVVKSANFILATAAGQPLSAELTARLGQLEAQLDHFRDMVAQRG